MNEQALTAEVTAVDTNKTYLSKKNVFSFAASGFGQNMIISVVNSYLLFFFTNYAMIGYTATFAIMLAARIFDAFNDPIMGVVVDKTRTKWGKMRPYLLFAPIPLGILTALLFYVPNLSLNGRIAYAAIAYILWGIIYTIGDIPFWGLASSMTPNPQERVKFITFSRLFHSIGGASPMLLIIIMQLIFGEGKEAYLSLGIFAGVLGGLLFLFAFLGTEERCNPNAKAPTLKECFRYLFKNKPLLTVVSANVLGFGRAILTTAGLYVATYLVFDRPSFMSVETANTFMLVGFAVAGFLAMLFTPKLTKRFNYRQLALGCCAVGVIGNVLLLGLGYAVGTSIWLFLIMQIVLGMAYGLVSNINYAMIAESVDYLEWKEGERAEGVSISMQTLMNKLMTALQSSLLPVLLVAASFIEPTDAVPNPVQSDSAKSGLFLIVTLLPIACWLVSGVVYWFYDFVGEKRRMVYAELEERHNAKLAAAADAEAAGDISSDEMAEATEGEESDFYGSETKQSEAAVEDAFEAADTDDSEGTEE